MHDRHDPDERRPDAESPEEPTEHPREEPREPTERDTGAEEVVPDDTGGSRTEGAGGMVQSE